MGSSIANYAARAGLRAFVFSAAYASEAQIDHMAAGNWRHVRVRRSLRRDGGGYPADL